MILPIALVWWVGSGTLIACLCILVVVQLNEVRLDARFLIVKHFSRAGRDELDRIEQEFANKFIMRTANSDFLDTDDLDLIFIDYLADQYFLRNFARHLQVAAQKNNNGIKLCRSRLAAVEKAINEWAMTDLEKRIPERFFDERMKRNWKIKILLLTRPRFFAKRAQNLLIELRQAILSVGESRPLHARAAE